MREIVIVISDLYLEPGSAGGSEDPAAAVHASAREPSAAAQRADRRAAPGIEHLARFADRATLSGGWRPWVAHWMGLRQYADAPPASIASAPLAQALAHRPVWLATPLHLIAGLTSLHFDRRSILRLPREEVEELAASFHGAFHGSGLALHPLASGELLLSAATAPAPSRTTEPARMLLTPVAEALPAGEGAAALRRLSAELEMWLHAHPINAQRAQRGVPAVATLWIWGGGMPAIGAADRSPVPLDAAFGSDAYVRGLRRLAGGETRPMPVDWAAVIGEPRAQRALAVVEVAELLHAHPSWSLADAIAEIDRRLISPALAALPGGGLRRLILLANDRCLILRAADRWRVWRRRRAALDAFA